MLTKTIRPRIVLERQLFSKTGAQTTELDGVKVVMLLRVMNSVRTSRMKAGLSLRQHTPVDQYIDGINSNSLLLK